MATGRTDAIEVLAVGDVFVNRPEPATAVDAVADRFDAADLRVGNLEAPVSDRGETGSFAGGDALRMAPDAMAALSAAGFDLLSFANNHAMDYGPAALLDTMERLDRAGIGHAGAGRDPGEAESVAVAEAGGIRVGIVAFEATTLSLWITDRVQRDRAGIGMLDVNPQYPEPNVDRPDVDRLRRVVDEAAAAVDVLFAMLHFGASGYTRTTAQRHLARAAIEAGADAVIGGQPHVVQGVDVYAGAPICYSLGHFFWDPFDEQYPHVGRNSFPRDTVLAALETTADGVASVTLSPAIIPEATERPELVAPDSADFDRIAERIAELSALEGTTPERTAEGLHLEC